MIRENRRVGVSQLVWVLVAVLLIAGCGKDADDYVSEGNAYVARGDMANAALQYEKATEVDPENFEAHNSLGAVLSSMGDFNRAIDHFRLAIALNDSMVEGHYNLGRAYAETGKPREALMEFRQAAQLDTAYALAYMSAGAVFTELGMIDQAVDSYQRAIRSDPNLIQARVNLASLYIGTDRYDDGIEELLGAREVEPGNPSLASMAGRAAMLKRDFDLAIELLSEATRLDTTSLVYRNDLATALMLAGHKDEAITQWERLLELNPDPSMEQVVRQNLERAMEE